MPSEMQDRRITSVKTFVEEISKMRASVPTGSEQWFFRGQRNASWDVRPCIFRDDNLTNEHIIIDRAQRQNPVEFRDCVNNFEILTKLQHYGLGTRLLDVTLNPLVALFFASEESSEFSRNMNKQYTREEHDGRVFYRYVTGCALKDIQVRIALAIPFFEFGKSLSLEMLCRNLRDNNDITQSEYDQLVEDDYSKMIGLLQTNSFIIATNSNARLIQQRGAFLVSPSVNIKTNTDVKSSILSKAKMNLAKEFEGSFVIPAEKKKEIREELDFFNVNEATLFPELEHQMHYIQKQVTTSVGTVEEYSQYKRVVDSRESRSFEQIQPDIDVIIRSSLPNLDDSTFTELTRAIAEEVQVIDWQMKDSVHSRIRRAITRSLANNYSAVTARSKADEIISKLVG